MHSLVDNTLNPDRSVVIYGLTQEGDEILEHCVELLLKDVLEVTMTERNLDRRQERDIG